MKFRTVIRKEDIKIDSWQIFLINYIIICFNIIIKSIIPFSMGYLFYNSNNLAFLLIFILTIIFDINIKHKNGNVKIEIVGYFKK